MNSLLKIRPSKSFQKPKFSDYLTRDGFPCVENLQITSLSPDGRGIGKMDGKVFFVMKTAVGDVVDAIITSETSTFAFAKVERYIHQSEQRKKPICKHFQTCGGCSWMHMDEKHQIENKKKIVESALIERNVPFTEISPVIEPNESYEYRNKISFTFDPLSNALGLFHDSSKRVIPVVFCKMVDLQMNLIRAFIYKYTQTHKLSYCHLSANPRGLMRRITIRKASLSQGHRAELQKKDPTSQYKWPTPEESKKPRYSLYQVNFQFTHEDKAIYPLMEAVKRAFPNIASINYTFSRSSHYYIDNNQFHTYSDTSPFLYQSSDQFVFKISPQTFYQPNPKQSLHIFQKAVEFAGLTGNEVVYDLYCGVGTITSYLSVGAKKVVGIEYCQQSVDDAQANANYNKIKNVEFFAGDMQNVLTEQFIETHGNPDVIVADPPRKGMTIEVLKTIVHANPNKIVYISCNPYTLARDVFYLSHYYKITQVVPIEQFSHTHHIETVVLLEKKTNLVEELESYWNFKFSLPDDIDENEEFSFDL